MILTKGVDVVGLHLTQRESSECTQCITAHSYSYHLYWIKALRRMYEVHALVRRIEGEDDLLTKAPAGFVL